MLRTGVSFVPRKNLKLRRSTETKKFRHADRNASKDDRRKRKRDDERRSQWVERKQRPNGETRSITVRRGNELFLSDSRFQRPVARSRTGLNRAGSARPTSSTASRFAGWISEAARGRETFTRLRLRPCRKGCQDRSDIFQRRRTRIQLRCQCTIANDRRGTAFDLR